MSTLSAFRDHCRRMAESEHKPECPSLTPRPFWDAWTVAPDGKSMTWNGPAPEWTPPTCDGCLSVADRDLFARMAAEVDDYLAPQPDLFGDLSAEHTTPDPNDEPGARAEGESL